jgi:transcriptional regulator with XRE-family HTH domain
MRLCIDNCSSVFNANMNQYMDLADYVLSVVNADGVSLNEVARRSQRKGHKITQPYISRIISRVVTNPSVEKLKALAAGLGRAEEEVFAVARGQNLEDKKIKDALMNSIAFDYGRLSKKERDEIAPLIRALRRELDERLDKPDK